MTEDSIFDVQGFRLNVGIILLDSQLNKAFWGKRYGTDAWQFPQGGMQAGESDLQSAWRELYEELGLSHHDVELIGTTPTWFKYRLPLRFRRPKKEGFIQCIGQKQRWFLMRLTAPESKINLQINPNESPEFETWAWRDYWELPDEVVSFKRRVYHQALQELAFYFPDSISPPNRNESNEH